MGAIRAIECLSWLPVPNQELSTKEIKNPVLIGHRRNTPLRALILGGNLHKTELVNKIEEEAGFATLACW